MSIPALSFVIGSAVLVATIVGLIVNNIMNEESNKRSMLFAVASTIISLSTGAIVFGLLCGIGSCISATDEQMRRELARREEERQADLAIKKATAKMLEAKQKDSTP